MPPLFLYKKRNQARLSPKSVAEGLRAKRSKKSGCLFFVRLVSLTSAVGECVGERGGGVALFAKNSDSVNCEIAVKSWRSESWNY